MLNQHSASRGGSESPHKQFLRTNLLSQHSVVNRLIVISTLWKWNARIVISDVDGGNNYQENGYQLLFLSARAIVQADLTRSFLFNVKQSVSSVALDWDGKTLPKDLLLFHLMDCFPHCTGKDIKRLFPSDYNPYYAGFGNRDTDELSYRKIGIPKGKIFIINPKSYTSLHTLVNDMFPPTSSAEQEDYNSWNFWKVPLPEIEF
ncbi:hypothetical protein NC653_037135 [Populus alba x Populus x berolinensis]|uniref:LNS2/PITP domain-containing protein n=1 Tax=Populus alba x Populus x berolinensis TaxID=444605 RepID=A0AAD6LLX4_9ROSI|nr:hypothetical protein NC653_037135 [Populus alba x Populus x berolinensis]